MKWKNHKRLNEMHRNSALESDLATKLVISFYGKHFELLNDSAIPVIKSDDRMTAIGGTNDGQVRTKCGTDCRTKSGHSSGEEPTIDKEYCQRQGFTGFLCLSIPVPVSDRLSDSLSASLWQSNYFTVLSHFQLSLSRY